MKDTTNPRGMNSRHSLNSRPLADLLRPQSLSEYVGQEHLVGEGKVIRKLIDNDELTSMIFWGPPGTGKTTLARIIANETNAHFYQLSATEAGVKEIRLVAEFAKKNQNGPVPWQSDLFKKVSGSTEPPDQVLNDSPPLSNQRFFNLEPPNFKSAPSPQPSTDEVHNSKTILFIDEIHRFSKAQQDRLLPMVEDGTITLIGATTENPSFEVISPLLSRSKVFVLKSLTVENLLELLQSAIARLNEWAGVETITIGDKELKAIATTSNGDARTALNTLELAVKLGKKNPALSEITVETVKEAVQKKHLMYDKTGEEHYNTISAFIKSMRASDPDAAIYYLTRMIEAGEDPKFIARRMVVFASEDIGLANPTALVVANAVFRACETVGYPECAITLAHGAAYLANCKKDRSAHDALRKAQADVHEYGNLPIPLYIRNAPTELMKDLGYGKRCEKYLKEGSYLPEELKGKKYF